VMLSGDRFLCTPSLTARLKCRKPAASHFRTHGVRLFATDVKSSTLLLPLFPKLSPDSTYLR